MDCVWLVASVGACTVSGVIGWWLGGEGWRKHQVTEAKQQRDAAVQGEAYWYEMGSALRSESSDYAEALREIEERAHAARCKAAKCPSNSTSENYWRAKVAAEMTAREIGASTSGQ